MMTPLSIDGFRIEGVEPQLARRAAGSVEHAFDDLPLPRKKDLRGPRRYYSTTGIIQEGQRVWCEHSEGLPGPGTEPQQFTR